MSDLQLAERIAGILEKAHASGRREAAPSDVPSYEEALEIQRRTLPALGAVSGFKVGAFRPGQPAMAPIPVSRSFASGADVPVRDRIGIELEIGFEVLQLPDADMRRNPQVYFKPRIVFELCDQRFSGEALDPALKLADMQLNDGLVTGPAWPDWDGCDFGHLHARLECGEATVVDGPVEVPGGSALANLWTLLDHLGTHCGGIAVGHMLITGSVSGLSWCAPGTDVHGVIAGFNPITCRIKERRAA